MRSSDVAALRDWLKTVSYSAMRRIEQRHPVLLPNGNQLRGLPIIPDKLVLGRDRVFYYITNGTAQCTSLRRVLMDVSLDTIAELYDTARVAAFERRQAKYASAEDDTQ